MEPMIIEALGRNNIKIQNAHISLKTRNFSGRKDQFNRDGNRKFTIVLEDQEQFEFFAQRGVNVKIRQFEDTNSGEIRDVGFIKVAVNLHSQYPPKIYVVNQNGPTELDESTIGSLDDAYIEKVNVILNVGRPYTIPNGGGEGRSLFLSELVATIGQAPERFSFMSEYNI